MVDFGRVFVFKNAVFCLKLLYKADNPAAPVSTAMTISLTRPSLGGSSIASGVR